MLYFTRWKALAIILTALVVCLCAVPNFFPEAKVKTWPAWAQRRLVLGLDLQGGSHILLEVDQNDIRKKRLDSLRDEAPRALREVSDVQTGLAKLRDLSQPLGGVLQGNGQRTLEVADAGGGLIRLTPTDAANIERARQTID